MAKYLVRLRGSTLKDRIFRSYQKVMLAFEPFRDPASNISKNDAVFDNH